MPLRKIFQHDDIKINLEFENIVKNAQSKDHLIVDKKPSNKEGIDGEIRIWNPDKKESIYLLIKVRGVWREIDVNKLIEILEREAEAVGDHDALRNVRHYIVARDGDGHISKDDGVRWELHRTTIGNPHGTQNYETFVIGYTRPENPRLFQFFGNLETKQLEMWNGEKWVLLG